MRMQEFRVYDKNINVKKQNSIASAALTDADLGGCEQARRLTASIAQLFHVRI